MDEVFKVIAFVFCFTTLLGIIEFCIFNHKCRKTDPASALKSTSPTVNTFISICTGMVAMMMAYGGGLFMTIVIFYGFLKLLVDTLIDETVPSIKKLFTIKCEK